MKPVVFLCTTVSALAIQIEVSCPAVTLNLVPEADSAIRDTAPDLNLGISPSLPVGVSANGSPRNRGLLQFDLSAIPTNATVTGASLRLIVTQSQRPPASYGLHPWFTNWAEAEVTWTNRTASVPWAADGGQSGIDFAAVPAATTLLGAIGTTSVFSGPGLAANVQSWVDDSTSNFGWLLMAVGEAVGSGKQIGSRENPGNESVLTVDYTIPAAPLVLTILPRTNELFRFSFQAEANRGYSAQYSSDLRATNWETFQVFDPSPQPGEREVQDSQPVTSSNRFFRVRSL